MDVLPVSGLAALAAADDQAEGDELNNGDPSSRLGLLKRQFIRTLHKVIDQSDLILLVLDARDPEGCRSRLVEDEVRRRESDGKKLIFVLNKIGVYLSAIISRRCQP
jgi:nuclear GTP-binding protein